MATPTTMMRPLAPAKPTATTSSKSATTNNTSKARTLAPAPSKIAPAQGARPLKPLIAAKASPSINSSSSTTVRKLAPLVPTKSGKNETTAAHSYTSKQTTSVPPASKIIHTSSTSTSSLNAQAKRLEEEREKMSLQEDYESVISDDDYSDQESQSPSSSTTNARETEGDTTDKIQPKKEWVLPARAKPGRKPSEVEPPTKRKAQNRASQRAFRERRQSYLASLEAKVNEYEERGANFSTELQKVARRLKEENDELKQQNKTLHAKVQQLEVALALRNSSRSPATSVKVEDVTMDSPQSTTARHEIGMPVSMLLEDAPRRTSWDWSTGSSRAGQSSLQTSPEEQTAEMHRDCGFCTEQSPCVCSGEAVLDFSSNSSSTRKQTYPSRSHIQPSSLPLRAHLERRAISRQKLWYTVPASQQAAGRQVQICPTANLRKMNNLRAFQPLPMIQSGSSMLPPPMQSPRKASLWPVYPLTSPKKTLSGMIPSSPQMPFSRGPQTPPLSPQQPTIFRMKKVLPGAIPAVCSGDPNDCAACATDPALAAFCRAVSSHLEGDGVANAVMLDAGNALPLRKRRMRGMSTSMQRVSNAPMQLTPQSLYTNGAGVHPSTRPKLWSVSRNGYQGDPNASATSIPSNTQTRLSSLRRHTTSDVRRENKTSEPEIGIETIPEAWQRIKQHPSFANWQGGLDLLADVVTRKSSDEEGSNTSQSSPHKIEDPTPAPKQHLTTEEDLGKKRRQIELEQSTKEEGNVRSSLSESSSQYNKRRKLYVDRRRVDDVLALMDRGTPSVTASPPSPTFDEGQACACPLSKIM
ncbi:uncharacterized protein FA14DRAFT_161165 [Meira miltonrushii]|uniref:BZIP domain-containing protein n=1 Tax=Meira miltonrushii TaxID=1280837 RepID=A0A316V6G2_9BASI|nr:uncharacterized protein FA14DRAFT_161165 [Meira miltonrushii]PWN33179.1 hypothetical protein FA14DRAFT_161165 [Meira miltonrushii]